MRRPAFGYQNAVLSAIAVLLALGLIDRRSGGEFTSLPTAQARQPERGGMTNDLEQRAIIISELRTLGTRLERIEAKLNAGINVKVTSMPATPAGDADKKPKVKNGDEAAAPAPSKPSPSK